MISSTLSKTGYIALSAAHRNTDMDTNKPAPLTEAEILRLVPSSTPRNGAAKPKKARGRKPKRHRINQTEFAKDWMEGVLTNSDLEMKFNISIVEMRKLAAELELTRDIDSHSRRLSQLKIAAAQIQSAVRSGAGAQQHLPTVLDAAEATAETSASEQLAMRREVARSVSLLNALLSEIEALSNPELAETLKEIANGKVKDTALSAAIDDILKSATLSSRLGYLDMATNIQKRLVELRRLAIGLAPPKAPPTKSGGEYEALLRAVIASRDTDAK